MIPIVVADASTFESKVRAPRDELVILYFWGYDCPNCDVFAKHLPAVLEDLGDVRARLVKVNAYDEPDLATEFGIYGVPAFFLFRDGKKLGRMSEFRGRRFFVDVIREHLGESGAP